MSGAAALKPLFPLPGYPKGTSGRGLGEGDDDQEAPPLPLPRGEEKIMTRNKE